MTEYKREKENYEDRESGGTLLDITLTDVLQVLSVNRKTCTLFLRKEDERGEIYLREGKIMDASVGEFKGEEALFYLLNWEGADFFIGTFVESGIETRIDKDLHVLIMEWLEQQQGQKEEIKVESGIKTMERKTPELIDETLIFLKKLEASGLIKALK